MVATRARLLHCEAHQPLRQRFHMKRRDPRTSAVTKPKRAATAARRRRRPSPSNEELLDKALELFYEHGYERTSIDTITSSVGLAKRTIYQRYGDKKSLFIAALQRAIERWIVPIERLQAVETDDLEETLLAIGQILVDNVLSPAGLRLLRLTNAESGRMPEIGKFTVTFGEGPTIRYLANLLPRYFASNGGGLPDPEDAAEAFLHLVVGGPANEMGWGVARDKEAIDRRVRFSVRLFVHGLMSQYGPLRLPSQYARLSGEYVRLHRLLNHTIRELASARDHLERTAAELQPPAPAKAG